MGYPFRLACISKYNTIIMKKFLWNSKFRESESFELYGNIPPNFAWPPSKYQSQVKFLNPLIHYYLGGELTLSTCTPLDTSLAEILISQGVQFEG